MMAGQINQKNKNIQILRAILSFLVVFIHTNIINYAFNFEYYTSIIIRTIANISVPTFYFLNGYLFNFDKYYNNKKEYIRNKIKRIIIPLLIYDIIFAIIQIIENGLNIDLIKKVITFSTAGHLYYLVVLILLLILTPFFNYILKNNKKNIYLIFIINAIYLILYRYLIFKYNYVIPYHEYIILGWQFYYVLGLYISNNKQNINNKNCYIPILSMIFTISYNFFIYKKYGFENGLSQMNIINLINSYFVIRYIIINFIFGKQKDYKFLIKIGNRSFGIYLIHIIFLLIFKAIFNINSLILVILAQIIIYTLSYISIAIFSKITKSKYDLYLGFK